MFAKKTALVIGGTSGIGKGKPVINFFIEKGIVLALSRMEIGTLILAGRSQKKGEDAVNETKAAANPEKTRIFFRELDASSIRDIKKFLESFESEYKELDYLIMTQGIATLDGRTETLEGLDRKLATNYYGRFYIIQSFLPLLKYEAIVLSVFAAVKGGPAPENDFALERNYGVYNASQVAPFHNDLMVESFALQLQEQKDERKITFIHAYPGLVDTPLFSDYPWYLLPFLKFMNLFGSNPEAIGEMFRDKVLANDAYKGPGWFLVNEKGCVVEKLKAHTEEMRKLVWNHTLDLIDKALHTPQ